MKAVWQGQLIADSQDTVVVENNHYFPQESVNMQLLKKSGHQYVCPWKGTCDYYDIIVSGDVNKDAAWVYPSPKPAAKEIAGRFAFWHGVQISE